MAKIGKIVMAGAVSSVLLGSGLFAVTVDSASAAAGPCAALFDDFSYSSPSDGSFTGNGWSARSNAGGPGLPGATWSAANISFPTVDGQKVAQLQASTNGTAAGTSQAEFLQTRQRFLNGTYASRIKFQDAPTAGPDGDHINETFFAIGPAQRYDYDPLYSELDFSEYLPNGGWGATGPINYQTSYNGYREDPWDPHNKHSQETQSFAGWHDLVTTVADGHVKYYIDGTLEGDHTVDEQTGTYPVYPRVPMTVNFNLWLIDTAGHTGGTSTWTEAVDWFYYAKNQVLTPAAAVAQAAAYRSAGTTHTDNLDTGNCPTSPTPTASTPGPTPTATPSPTPTTPANCSAAAEWDWSTVYLGGQRVKHNAHLWEANWWTQGSEPGQTAQWKDLGRC